MADRDVGELIAWSSRGSVIETRHTAHVVAVVNGKSVNIIGNPDIINPLRSTGKAFLLSVLHKAFPSEVADQEIALFSSSHNGELYHTQALQESLAKRGLSEQMLKLGPQTPIVPGLPFEPPLQDGLLVHPLQNNCSGKHVGLLILTKLLGQDLSHYADPNYPAMKLAYEQLYSLTRPYNTPVIPLTDGCGVPTYGLALRALAHLYAFMLADDAPMELRRVARAFLDHPYAVGGAKRANTAILRMGLVAKEGFEGLFVLATANKRTSAAVAIKVDSGSDPVAEAIIMRLAEAITGRSLPADIYPGFGLTDQLGNPTGAIHVETRIVADTLRVIQAAL